MSQRTHSLRALALSLFLFAVAGSGFVAAGFAKGSARSEQVASIATTSTIGTEVTAPDPTAAPGSTTTSGRSVPAEWLGHSNALRAAIGTADVLGVELTGDSVAAASLGPGVHDLGMKAPDGEDFVVVSLLPYGEKRGTRLNGYYVGDWPNPDGKAARYARPAGFIEVTAANAEIPVSRNFKLGDFLTHDQQGVWPKVLVLQPRLLDKLELIEGALAARGLPHRLHVMSGFRTPQYNEQGVGPKGGRASLSRHMYGDASDVFVDADGNGVMDDLNGDGRSTVADAQVLLAVADQVEQDHPDLIGGLSAYPSNGVHGPFVHVDARGVKARW